WPLLARAQQQVITAHAAELAVDNRHEKLLAAVEHGQCLLRALYGFGGVAFVPKHRLQRNAHVLLVVDDEYWWKGSFHACIFIKVLVGNFTVKRAPFPSSDSTQTPPPYISALCRTIDSPRPVPFSLVEKYGSNTFWCLSRGIPGPLSVTVTTTDGSGPDWTSTMI